MIWALLTDRWAAIFSFSFASKASRSWRYFSFSFPSVALRLPIDICRQVRERNAAAAAL